jgi:hypothetical protein
LSPHSKALKAMKLDVVKAAARALQSLHSLLDRSKSFSVKATNCRPLVSRA